MGLITSTFKELIFVSFLMQNYLNNNNLESHSKTGIQVHAQNLAF